MDNPRQQRRLPALQKIFEQKIQFAQTVIGLRQTLGTQAAAAAIRNGAGQEVTAEFQGVERAMRDEELRLLVLRYADANRRLDQTKDILLVGTLLGVLIAAFAGLSAQRFGIRRGLAEDALRDSESRFRQMAESISDAFFLMEADSGKMLYVSPAYEQMSGRTRESLYADSKSWTDAMHPDDRDAIREKYKAGIAAGEFEYETRYLRPGGVTQWVKVRGYPVRNDAGEIVRIAGVVRDITERKLGEQDLRESERRFSGLLGSVQLASVMLDSEQRITYCNEYLLKLTGWTIEEVIGRDWVEAFVPVELHATMPVFAQLLTSQAAWHRESEILTRSGERRLMRWNVSVLRSGTGDCDRHRQHRRGHHRAEEGRDQDQTSEPRVRGAERHQHADRSRAGPRRTLPGGVPDCGRTGRVPHGDDRDRGSGHAQDRARSLCWQGRWVHRFRQSPVGIGRGRAQYPRGTRAPHEGAPWCPTIRNPTRGSF